MRFFYDSFIVVSPDRSNDASSHRSGANAATLRRCSSVGRVCPQAKQKSTLHVIILSIVTILFKSVSYESPRGSEKRHETRDPARAEEQGFSESVANDNLRRCVST